ncbi:DUF262 domain-containing protein [Treponema socranskii]|uniref:DUF262 domain-containing protein n=1 Tax=Treponema socranskii TaxID=53419 RepID=UPI0028715C81|nr:DUF262 domain-containing HNH endonuclease family protein [Treponema socranskii]MDR9859645.1 DUF262 domain-containing HNH endonuclease family protein [Treponema socranskii]
MMQGIKNTSNETFVRLMGNGLHYEVPRYQRDYSWTIEQWSDLWYDIVQLLHDEDSHYMGYLVLQTNDDKNYQIIDGQQRLTTLSILILAVIKSIRQLSASHIEKTENERRAQNIHSNYIGNLDMLTLTSINKLVLNRNNDGFYKNYLSAFNEFPKRGLKTSEKLLKNSFEYFYSLLSDTYRTAEDLIRFLDTVVNNIFFTVITVTDELNAFKVFETLNARGVQLSSSDLLKNYIFSVADTNNLHDTHLEELENRWIRIADTVKDAQISDFLRIYWNSNHKTIRKNQLYRTIRNEIKTPEQAFALLRDLQKNADIYMALKDPHDEMWQASPDIRENLRLLKLFNVTQPMSLLLAAYARVSLKTFSSLLKKIVVLSFRYNVICGKNPNEQENAYNTIALDIQKNGMYDTENLKRNIYVFDAEFEQTFAYKDFIPNTRNNQIAKYILVQLEKFETGMPLNEDDVTLEHILPCSPDEKMWKWDDGKIRQYRYRLGNMILLEAKKNRDIGNASFAEKKTAYAASSIPTAKKIAELDIEEWTEETIESRQHKMALAAKTIWTI